MTTTEHAPSIVPLARVLEHGDSIVSDPAGASTLYNKGYYGNHLPRGGLALDPLETVYLTEAGRLAPHGDGDPGARLPLSELLRRAYGGDETFDIHYLVYRDLRQRGYVVKPGTGAVSFSVLPRGGTYPRTPSLYWVVALSERTPFSLPSLLDLLDRGRRGKKRLLLGVVDEESDLTYYAPRLVVPKGHQPAPAPGTLPAMEGIFLTDRVSVFDAEAIAALGEHQMFGSRVGERLELSLLEALYLVTEGRLHLTDGRTGKPLSRKAFLTVAGPVEGDLEQRLPVYTSLRKEGLLPKTGFKYGTHFRAYESDPTTTHARYLVHVVPPDFESSWPELSRAIRVAQGVRKSFLLGIGEGEPIQYVHLQRVRP